MAARAGSRSRLRDFYKVVDKVERPESVTVAQTFQAPMERYVHGGSKVVFDHAGHHTQTLDGAYGVLVAFNYTPEFKVDNIVMTTGTDAPVTAYQFGYLEFIGRLRTILARGSSGTLSQLTRFHPTTGGLVTGIEDPDNLTTTFGYVGTNLLQTRIDKRLNTTTFSLDAAQRLVQVARPLNASETATTSFCAAELRGMKKAGTCSGASIEPFNVFLDIDGPRPTSDVKDSLRVWVTRFGAPEVVRDPFGKLTQYQHGAAGLPGLISAVVDRFATDSSFAETATHDARGNLQSVTEWNPLGDGQNSTTQFTWASRCDALARIDYPNGNFLSFGVDTFTCLRVHEEDGRGAPSRVVFRYNVPDANSAARLMTSIVYPIVRPGETDFDSLTYDTQGNLANVFKMRVVGTDTSLLAAMRNTSDPIGRLTSSCVDIVLGGAQQCENNITYDAMGRPTLTATLGPANSVSPAQEARVRRFYDEEGDLRQLDRWDVSNAGGIGTITTTWRRDKAGRVVAEVAPDLRVDSTRYDLAGNPVELITRRRNPAQPTGPYLAIQQHFDALNRLVQRVVPSVTYPSEVVGIAALGAAPPQGVSEGNPPYPRYPNNGTGGYTIPGDVQDFVYHSLTGKLSAANSRDALVSRTYYPGNRLKTERLQIRTLAPTDSGGSFGLHDYTVTYEYDRSGRRTKIKHPAVLANGLQSDQTVLEYDPVHGALFRVTDPTGGQFTFGYNGNNDMGLTRFGGRVSARNYAAACNCCSYSAGLM